MTNKSNSKVTDTNVWVQWIEDGITKDYINNHDYNEFQNIQHISSGTFSKVYWATWESRETVVALKSFFENKSFMKRNC
jgi:hypothetical protein